MNSLSKTKEIFELAKTGLFCLAVITLARLLVITYCSLLVWLTSDWQEQLELWWQLVFGVQSVGEVDSTDSAVGVDLNSQSLDVVSTVGSSGEIRQVELDLIPSFIKSHGHGTDEWLDSGGRLVVRGSEPSSNLLVVQDLDLEGEVFLQVLDDHDQEGQLNSQGLLWVKRSVDVVGRHVSTHDLQHGRLDVGVGDSLDVTVSHLLVPDLQWLGTTSIINVRNIFKPKVQLKLGSAESLTAQDRETYPIE